MKQLLAWLVLLLLTASSHGQSQPMIVKTQGSNLFANVNCAMQDKAGHLWFGTTGEGIYRYDGKAFTDSSEIEKQ
jgi:hypothetical protein